jgi:hypothetical protein
MKYYSENGQNFDVVFMKGNECNQYIGKIDTLELFFYDVAGAFFTSMEISLLIVKAANFRS